jgi:broad specificity phosphatase PhoE
MIWKVLNFVECILIFNFFFSTYSIEIQLQVIKDPDLRERHLGDLQGLVLQEAAKVSAVAYRAFKSHRTNQDIPVCQTDLFFQTS